MSERLEHFFDIIVSFSDWNIFNVDIVDHFSEMSSVLWLELDGLNSVDGLGVEDIGGRHFLLEADEAVASG